jgi:uncharacterized protein (DUF433 family)
MAQLVDRITVDPEQCGGRPCIRGMRIRVTDVLDSNARLQEVLRERFPEAKSLLERGEPLVEISDAR